MVLIEPGIDGCGVEDCEQFCSRRIYVTGRRSEMGDRHLTWEGGGHHEG
jgi:hypothetical protein